MKLLRRRVEVRRRRKISLRGGGSSFEGGAPRFLSSHSQGSPDFAPLIAGCSLVMCCDSEVLMLKIEKLLHIHL